MKVKSILVSQPQPTSESSPYYSLGEKQKVKVDFRPFIHVEGLNAKDIRQQKIDLSKYNAIVLTSRNAVDHFFRIAQEMRFIVPDAMKYFCQSEAVAYYLQKYIVYRKRKVYIGGKSFLDLKPILKKHKNLNFLVPSSDTLKPEVIKVMNDEKLNWKRAIMYQTVSSDLSDLNDVEYDILVFFSPSGIKSLFENFPDFKQDQTKIAAFGKSTVSAANEMGLKIDIPVPTPETPSMAMALEKFIKENNK
ncbi:uroporphyrinogen-III synthase [Flavobacteriaceae bacterium Ap0902]|nr:uroporphyrinogen-III synthase [Flavobacteriaceae bacterium Ap0902]